MKAIKVLIIDEEDHVCLMLRQLLSCKVDITVENAKDSETGLAIASALRPDLIIMDVNIPGCDGLTTLQRFHAVHHDAIVVVYTSLALREVVEECASMGIVHFIRKDTPPEQVGSILCEVLKICDEQPNQANDYPQAV